MYIYIIRKKKITIENEKKNYIPVIIGVGEDGSKYKNKKVLILNNNDVQGYIKIVRLITNKDSKYNSLLKESKIMELDSLYFIEHYGLIKFEKIIKRSEINKILDIKIRINGDNFTLVEYEGKDLLKIIIREIDKQNLESESEESEEESEEESDESEEEEDNEDKINLGIPISWKLCTDIGDIISENKKMNKKLIMRHLCDCKECEITNNNKKEIDIKKKMMFSESKDNIEKIMDCYERCIDYIETEEKINEFKRIDDIGLIYDDNDTYGKMIMII